MKILCIIQCTNLGGMEQCTLLLLDEFLQKGIQVEVLSLNPVGELGALLEQRGIPTRGIAYRGRGGWRSFWALRRLLRRTEADAMIMVGHNFMGMLAIGSRWKNRRLLVLQYHHEGVMPAWRWRLIYRLAIRKFRCVFYPSEFIKSEALGLAPFLKPVVQVIDNPVSVPPLPSPEDKRQARLKLNLPEGVKVVGNAGWLIPRKRWDVFLNVAARVVGKYPSVSFLIAGDGPERSNLEAQARALGIQDRIRWLGWQKDLSDFYQSLDVHLFNSDWDAMPRTPQEAMSYAVPVVASVLHGGTREMITDESVGVCLPEHDLEKLAHHVVHFLADGDAAEHVGKAGRERIKTMGDPKRYADRMLQALGY
jgi:glycosyltransferase involved in cell wall biosynthesis